MGIWLGLLSAFSFGTADYWAGKSSRRVGVYQTLFYMQLFGPLLLTAAMSFLGEWHKLTSPCSGSPAPACGWVWI
ncbi:hypothetical protein LJK87_14515 [Paenibacillus sp. P25]|nr:hypothetical protein LJK87_14515 [Paenibacillus sp. P25]